MLRIYKLNYYYFFLQSAKKNNDPEVSVYLMLAIMQTSNFITVMNMIFLIFKIHNVYDIRKLAIIGPITFCIFNYYYFTKRGNGKIIMEDNTYNLGKYSFLLYLCLPLSMLLLIVSSYFYQES